MSLRTAIKRSLEEAEGPKKRTAYIPSMSGKKYDDGAPAAPIVTPKRRPPRRVPKEASIVELTRLKKCIRSKSISAIDEKGFVEMSQLLPLQLIESLRSEAEEKLNNLNNRQKKIDGFVKISNALQANVSNDLAEKVSAALLESDMIHNTMQHVFGKGGESSYYDGFEVQSLKLLSTPPGSPPQLPHADDHCTSCLFGIVHLKDGQLRTRIAKYNSNKDYPTGITSTCDNCHREEQLPDEDYKRGVHLTTEKWYCGHCNEAVEDYDFEMKFTTAFDELLHNPNICDAYAGGMSTSNANDGILALPTLIHCGPGNPSTSTNHRMVLFFTVRPSYKNTKRLTAAVKNQHKYNEDLQIHAPCILYHQFQKTMRIYERAGCNLRNYSSFIVGANAADLNRLTTDLARARSRIVSQERRIEELMLRVGESER